MIVDLRISSLATVEYPIETIGTSHEPYATHQLSGASDHVFCPPLSRDTGVVLYATTHWCLGSFYYRLIFGRAAASE